MNDGAADNFTRRRAQAALVKRAQCGERDAFDTLVKPLRGALLGIAFVRSGGRQDAEDLTQDALTKAWTHIEDLHDPVTFAFWLRSILYRCCATWYRRSVRWPESLSDIALLNQPANQALPPLDILLQRERDEELRVALRSISEENRTALLMSVWGDCTYQEIADFTGVPLTTVEGRIYRAKAQLRRSLRNSNAAILIESSKRWQERA